MRGRLAALAVAITALIAAAPAAAITLKPGDILIADDNAFGTAGCTDTNGCGGLIKVDPVTGKQTAISNNAISAGDPFTGPTEITLDAKGRVLMSQYDGAVGENGSVIRVDPATGQATLVSDTGISGPDLFVDPFGILVEPSRRILVADSTAFANEGGVIGVNPTTGQQSAVSNNVISAADLYAEPFGLGVSRRGRPLVADISSGADMLGAILQVSPTGQASAVTDNEISATDAFAGPLDVDADGARSLLVTDYQIDSATGGLITVNPAGQASLLSTNTISSTDLFDTPFSSVVTPQGKILVADEDSQGVNDTGAVITVNRSSGEQTAVSNNDISGPDLFVEPDGIMVVPPRCGGRFATIVGTTRRDVIKGSRFADVIATLGGRDTIKGKGGKDLICGGGGRDRLIGGGGRDKLFGQAGGDILRGGKGRDQLRGGPGRDTQAQ